MDGTGGHLAVTGHPVTDKEVVVTGHLRAGRHRSSSRHGRPSDRNGMPASRHICGPFANTRGHLVSGELQAGIGHFLLERFSKRFFCLDGVMRKPSIMGDRTRAILFVRSVRSIPGGPRQSAWSDESENWDRHRVGENTTYGCQTSIFKRSL